MNVIFWQICIMCSLHLPTMMPSKYSPSISLCLLHFLPMPSAPFYISDAFPPPCDISSSFVHCSRCHLCPPLALFQLIAWTTVEEWIDSLVRMQQLLPNRVEGSWVLLPLLSMETLIVSILSVLIVTLTILTFCQLHLKLDNELKKNQMGTNPLYKTCFLRKYAKKILIQTL